MYETFFGLKETPFSIAPNPHYLYMSKQHNEALAHLVYGVGREGGFVLLTGEVGTGKTTVCRCFLEQIPEDTDVAFILNPKLNSEELLATICDELSIAYIGDSMTIKDYVDFINERLLKSHSKGRHTVLIIDEAQNLEPEVLEQLRLLTNLETHEKKLLQIVLLGQPELQEMFQRKELRQLAQRVTARFHLDALKQEELEPYVMHRLAIAGAIDPKSIFPKKSIQALFQISKGIPRVINLVCDRALLGAYSQSQRVVEPSILKSAAAEVLGKQRTLDVVNDRWWKKLNSEKIVGAIGLAAICGLSAGLGVWLSASILSDNSSNVSNLETIKSQVAVQQNVTPPPSIAQAQPTPNKGVVDSATESVVDQEDTNLPDPNLAFEEPTASGEPAQKTDQNNSLRVTEINSSDLLTQYASDLTEKSSYVSLLATWGVEYEPAEDGLACQHVKHYQLSCLNKIGSLGSLKHLGLPALLTFFDNDGEKRYAFLRSIDEQIAYLVVNQQLFSIRLSELDKIWRGHFVLLWKVPPNYKGPLQPGTIGPLTKWLSKQLDIYEGVDDPVLGRSFYDEALVSRVKAFQQTVGEQADGIVGINTLIQLSKYTDKETPLLLNNQEQL